MNIKKKIFDMTEKNKAAIDLLVSWANGRTLGLTKSIYTTLREAIFKEEIEKLNIDKLLKMMEDEKVAHLLLQSHDAVLKSKEIEKAKIFTKFFKKIVDEGEFSEENSYEIEEFIYLFSTFSYREILVLHKIREFTKKNPEVRKAYDNHMDIGIGDYNKNWNKVIEFLKKLSIKNPEVFLARLENSKLIVDSQNYGIYISTSYFDDIYNLSEDLEKYLDKCVGDKG